MHIAERLYLSGYLTYPRTESTSYPQKFGFKEVAASLKNIQEYGQYCNSLLNEERMKFPKAGKDAGDHPPITPTTKIPNKGTLRNDEWRVYDFVSRHFLSTIGQDGKFMKKSVKFSCGKFSFSLSGSCLIDPGFQDITPWIKVADNLIPDFKIGQKLPVSIVDIVTGQVIFLIFSNSVDLTPRSLD